MSCEAGAETPLLENPDSPSSHVRVPLPSSSFFIYSSPTQTTSTMASVSSPLPPLQQINVSSTSTSGADTVAVD